MTLTPVRTVPACAEGEKALRWEPPSPYQGHSALHPCLLPCTFLATCRMEIPSLGRDCTMWIARFSKQNLGSRRGVLLRACVGAPPRPTLVAPPWVPPLLKHLCSAPSLSQDPRSAGMGSEPQGLLVEHPLTGSDPCGQLAVAVGEGGAFFSVG